MLKKGFEDLSTAVTDQMENVKLKVLEDIQSNNSRLFKSFEDSLKRLENYEKSSNENFTEFNTFKSENNSRLTILEENLWKEIKEIKKDISNSNMKIENMDKKYSEHFTVLQKDFDSIHKEFNFVKNELEMFKGFKENTILNFKDITGEFIKK